MAQNKLNTNYVCSGQAIKLWNAFQSNDQFITGTIYGTTSSGVIIPIPAMSPDSVYAQII